MLKLFALALVAAAVVFAAPSSKINSKLFASLASKGTANVLVSMKEDTSAVLNNLDQTTFTSRNARLNTVANSLKNFAAISQKVVISHLAAQKAATYQVFWITNQVYVKNADLDLIQELAAIDDVSDISEEFEVRLIDPIVEVSSPGILAPEWGIEHVRAPEAWVLGYNGTGTVVGAIDTGVLLSHIDLQGNYLGEHGWFDVITNSYAPFDDNGHGTHTMGTIVGAGGIGVAPGAKWMACKALSGAGAGTNAGLISCGQFIACPTLPDSTNPDCSKAPNVVSNSWGGGQGNTFYNAVINTWRSAGIIPVFANGNSGPGCTTANSPGDNGQVIAVGATTFESELASYSSKGPTIQGPLKPDISAPGSLVRSAWHTGNADYNTISGTSMAAPHVAGVAALLLGKNPNWFYVNVRNAIINNANRDVKLTGYTCGNIDETVWPNHAYGHGIIDAFRAIQSA